MRIKRTISRFIQYLVIVSYDCGDMSNAVITSEYFTGPIKIINNGVLGKLHIREHRAISFLCSGEMSISAPQNSINVFLSSVSLQGVWSENFLMGLAGVICGSLLAYICVKYAV